MTCPQRPNFDLAWRLGMNPKKSALFFAVLEELEKRKCPSSDTDTQSTTDPAQPASTAETEPLP